MLLAAAGEAAQQASNFTGFDIFMILFTILALFALVRAKQHRNKFAMAFSALTLLVFLFADVVMVLGWMNML